MNPFTSNDSRFNGTKPEGLFQGNLLRISFFSGLLLLLIIGGSLIAVYALGRGYGFENTEGASGFYGFLREYDYKSRGILAAGLNAVQRRELDSLDTELDRLEKKAEGVESWLSILKRRRQLARLDTRYVQAYRQSAHRAALAYPYSEPLAAVAAAALIQDTAITREAETELRRHLPQLSDARFNSLRLGLHVLLGDFKTPQKAVAALPHEFPGKQLSAALWRSILPTAAEAETIAADLAIVRLLRGDAAGAAAEIQAILSGDSGDKDASPPPELVRFAAEYYYDFGDLLRSAELFSHLQDDKALGRQADALWLANYAANARRIWSMLATPRSLYNLALTAETPEEAAGLLERLAALPETAGDPSLQYGLVRYSRLLNAPRAIAILETGKDSFSRLPEKNALPEKAPLPTEALIDLEILRRRTEIGETGRLIAETWLLLGRYPEAEALYRWGAWFFDLQRNYGETALLLRNAARHSFSGQWILIHNALQQARDGNLDEAESLFASIPIVSREWSVAANLGRILETRRAPVRALEQYEAALAAIMGTGEAAGGNRYDSDNLRRQESAARIQLRIAHCLKSLGRIDESRRALEYALDLNPENLDARLELHRLE